MSLSLAGDGTISGFDAGLSGFGGLVAVKSAIFTGTQTNSTASGANFAVTDLSITHEVADAANKLIISAFIGAMAASDDTNYATGIAIDDGSGLITVGASPGNRVAVSAGGRLAGIGGLAVLMPSIQFVHTPGAGSKTYTVRAVNVQTATRTIYVNRDRTDSNTAESPRAVSSLVIQEVKV